MEQPSASFQGWALVELMGHQREAGYVTTQYFGDKAMFQIDVPERPAQQETLTAPKWGPDDTLLPAGSVVEKPAVDGRTRLVNPSAVYAINPATEEAVLAALTASEPRRIKVISVPAGTFVGLPSSVGEEVEEEQDEDDTFGD